MIDTVTYVTQSKFFSPVFNGAIFDGPIRIYFAQDQEAQAIKVYYDLQQRFGEARRATRGFFKERGRNIFVMLYPTPEIFNDLLGSPLEIFGEAFGVDYVFAVRDQINEESFARLCRKIEILNNQSDSFTFSEQSL
jgi:hypothetical protein